MYSDILYQKKKMLISFLHSDILTHFNVKTIEMTAFLVLSRVNNK